MNILGIIPARYASSRLEGKPLAEIAGKPMVQWVYERAKNAIEYVVVATDDKRIFDAVQDFGGEVVMTSVSHKSGTDRCFEALQTFQTKTQTVFDVVVNIQGDEPLIEPMAIRQLCELFDNSNVDIATLVNCVDYTDDLLNPNKVKVVIDKYARAVYFSRSMVPFVRDNRVLDKIKFYTHIGIYAYRTNILQQIVNLGSSMLETAESLEQNRWIENGYQIYVATTQYQSIGVDTIDDLEKVRKMISI